MGEGDNRNYEYPNAEASFREEYQHILNFIAPSSSVVDFGCGDGTLLGLHRERGGGARLLGIDISRSGVELARERLLEAYVGSIDAHQKDLADKTFDVAVCNVTIQMLGYPEILMSEMARVARRQIISFPNFAHFKNRLEHLFYGRMPRSMLYGYSWYSTGHIHQLSLRDFKELCALSGLEIKRVKCVGNGFFLMKLLAGLCPNLFGKIILCEMEPRK